MLGAFQGSWRQGYVKGMMEEAVSGTGWAGTCRALHTTLESWLHSLPKISMEGLQERSKMADQDVKNLMSFVERELFRWQNGAWKTTSINTRLQKVKAESCWETPDTRSSLNTTSTMKLQVVGPSHLCFPKTHYSCYNYNWLRCVSPL